MTTYRVFILDQGNHIVGSELLDSATDREAMARAPEIGWAGFQAVEVWDLARFVGRVDLREASDIRG